MIQEIKMPSAGQATDDARIVAIHVRVGDTVDRGHVLMETETDKAVLPVESFAAGEVLDVLVCVGDTVTAGTPLAVIGKKEDAAKYQRAPAVRPSPPPADSAGGTSGETPAPTDTSAEESPAAHEEYLPILRERWPVPAAHCAYPAMPNAKWTARDNGVALDSLLPANGTFLTRKDVLSAAEQSALKAMPETMKTEDAEYTVQPMTRVRAVIGKRMQESMQTIPAWQCATAIDMTACMALRDEYLTRRGQKLSYNDILAKAVAVAARKYPLVNARYEGGEVRVYRHTNVGLAVALDGALMVPVVREIDNKGLKEISRCYREKIEKARAGKLAPADMGCGSVTISNLGKYAVRQFTAIVNPPESCILAVGSICVEPVWDGAAFQPVHRMTVIGSFDHRIIDGAYGAQFLQELKTLMEAPGLMLD